jgi:hypothetical protein
MTKKHVRRAGEAERATAPKPRKQPSGTKAAPKRSQKPAYRRLRVPAVGTKLTRTFKGEKIVVEVVEGGFKYAGQTFTSISAAARHITGYMISGPVFFKLVEPKRATVKEA